jgi:hypothetical protein
MELLKLLYNCGKYLYVYIQYYYGNECGISPIKYIPVVPPAFQLWEGFSPLEIPFKFLRIKKCPQKLFEEKKGHHST